MTSATNTPNPATGEELKADALERHHLRRPALIRDAQRALLNCLMDGGTATIEDARDAVEVPEGFNPKAFGSVPGTLARAGVIRRAAYVTAQRPAAHARPLSLWELADRDAALAWLATHPELPDDTASN